MKIEQVLNLILLQETNNNCVDKEVSVIVCSLFVNNLLLSAKSIIQNTGYKLFVDGLDVTSGGTQCSSIPRIHLESLSVSFNHLLNCSQSCFDMLNSKCEQNIDGKPTYTKIKKII